MPEKIVAVIASVILSLLVLGRQAVQTVMAAYAAARLGLNRRVSTPAGG